MGNGISPTIVHEPYRGFRFQRNGISIVMKMFSLGEELDEHQIFYSLQIFDEFHAKMTGETHKPFTFDLPISDNIFIPLRSGPLYKRMHQRIWDAYVSKGYFRLGTLQSYRQAENTHIKDRREGSAQITLSWRKRQLHCAIEVGDNCAVFCGTRRSRTASRTMSERFGPVLIQVTDQHEFAKCVSKKIGATRYMLHDVVYSDPKTLIIEHDFSEVESYILKHARHMLTDDALTMISDKLFDVLYNSSFLTSVFCKPLDFSIEKERRITFELPRDIVGGGITFFAPELLDLIKLVKE